MNRVERTGKALTALELHLEEFPMEWTGIVKRLSREIERANLAFNRWRFDDSEKNYNVMAGALANVAYLSTRALPGPEVFGHANTLNAEIKTSLEG